MNPSKIELFFEHLQQLMLDQQQDDHPKTFQHHFSYLFPSHLLTFYLCFFHLLTILRLTFFSFYRSQQCCLADFQIHEFQEICWSISSFHLTFWIWWCFAPFFQCLILCWPFTIHIFLGFSFANPLFSIFALLPSSATICWFIPSEFPKISILLLSFLLIISFPKMISSTSEVPKPYRFLRFLFPEIALCVVYFSVS